MASSPTSAPPPTPPPTTSESPPPPPAVIPPASPPSAPPPPTTSESAPPPPAVIPPASPPSAPPPPPTTATPPSTPPSAPPPPNTTVTPPSTPPSAPPPPPTTVTPPSTPPSAPPPPPTPVTPPSTPPSAPPPAISSVPPPSSQSLPSPPPPPSPGGESGSPPPPPPSNSTQGSDNGGSSSTSTGLVVGLVAGGAVLLVFFAFVFVFCKKKRRRDGNGQSGQPQSGQSSGPPPGDHAISIPPPSPAMSVGFSKSTFSFEELERATDGFSNANLLGQGGFGYVHRGKLPNGKEVAVKQLKAGSRQGEREFQAEVEIITRVHHKHLVSLIGYCIIEEKRLLVYEFVPNNTLEFHLHVKGRPTMEWSSRLKIALSSAKGLAYLHEDCYPKIIHRDIKAANILLDDNFDAKVADFGLAKFSADSNTHVSTRVMGTFGYLAPEYASSGKLTEKSDVFSFGVMLLELITGRKPINITQTLRDDSLVDWARPLLTRALEDGNYDFLVDPQLQRNYNTQEMAHMVACAAACVRHSARHRPRMTQIVRALEGDVSLDDLNEGVTPGHGTLYGSVGSSDYDSGQYNEDIRKFRKVALSSQEYTSSGYSALTSEYAQNPSGSSSEVTMKKDSYEFK